MGSIVIAILVGAVIGFVAGALVYRNNAQKFEAAKNEAEVIISKMQKQIDDLTDRK